MDYDSYVNATSAEVMEQVKTLKASSQKVYDADKNKFGKIERYDVVEHEVCDVEVLGSDAIFVDVPIMELFPHHAFRFRAGQRILLDGWVGVVAEIKRKVKIKRGNGSVLKFGVREESCGTYDSYMSSGKLPSWWDCTNPDKKDIYSAIGDEMGYPGSPVLVTSGMKLANESSNFFWTLKHGFKRLKDLIFRTDATRYQIVQDSDLVKKVKIKKVNVVWEATVDNVYPEVPESTTENKYIIRCAEVLTPLSQELCEEGSYRMYTLREGVTAKRKAIWLKEKIMKNGAPRSITVDEVDNLSDNSEWFEQHKWSIGDDLPVKVIVKKRFVEVRWEDDCLEILPISQVVKMIGTDNGDGSLYEINIETDNESVEQGNIAIPKPRPTEMVDEYNIPWLRNVPRFQKFDLVVDSLRDFPSSDTVYGVLRALNPKEFTAVVDWYKVDDKLKTSVVDSQVTVSIFDLEHMDDLHDPLFRIEWRHKRTSYGSDVVCSRFGTTELGFLAGYLREINPYGQIIANADSSVWSLWPSEVKRLDVVAHQTECGEWTESSNAICTDETAMMNSLSDYRWQQYKQKLFPHIDIPLTSGCELLSEYPRLRKLKTCPPNHWYLNHLPDSVSVSDSFDELNDPTVMIALVNQELKKTLIQIDGVDLFFCTYENKPNLASALMIGKQGTIYEDGLFMFDIYFPHAFPNSYPLLHYVCYATNLNPILEDAYTCGPIKPLKFLNMTLEEMSVSLGKQNASTLSLSASSKSSRSQNENGEGDHMGESKCGAHKRTYNLEDFIYYIQETLFKVGPEDVMGELFTGSLLKDHISIYHDFLLGKKLEALANMLLFPYEPWREFVHLSQECILRLLETSERMIEDRSKTTMKFDGSGDNEASIVNTCKGSVIFLQRRVEFLKKALDRSSETPTNALDQQQLIEPSRVSDPTVESVNSGVIEKKRLERKRYSISSSSYSSNRDSSVDGMLLPEIGSYNPCYSEMDRPDFDANSSLVTAFEEKFANLKFDETVSSYDCEQPAQSGIKETEIL
ncbi:unnamed protein product [Orchesella dallaii]|uniref:UBE2O-like SH3-B domain-containing protein n=1 Tax=Orchesella dallaii TaxID=48710 RepID=A0ABP1QPA6_9HEXA